MSPQFKGALRLLYDAVRSQGWRYFLVIGCGGLLSLSELLPPRILQLYTAGVTDIPRLSDVNAEEFIRRFLFLGISAAIVLFVTNVVWDIIQEWVYLRTEADLRRRMLRQMHETTLETFDNTQRGDWLTRMGSDLRTVEHFVAAEVPTEIRNACVLLGVTVMFLWHGGMLAALLLASAVVIVCINLWVQRILLPIFQELRTIHGHVLQALLESYEGLRTIRSLGVEHYVSAEFEKRVRAVTSRGMSVVRITSFLGGSNGFVTSVLSAVGLTVVAWRLRGGAMTVNDTLVFPFYIGMFYSSAMSVVGALATWSRYLVEGGRVAELFYGLESIAPHEALPSGDPQVVELLDVQVGYAGVQALTRPFDWDMVRGRSVVIRGPSGIGKSTFLEMLAGLRSFPEGAVRARDAAGAFLQGVPPRRVPVEWSAFVEQRPYLFEGTVRSNLSPGLTDIGEEQLWEVLHAVNLDAFVRQMGVNGVSGLDHVLRDSGKNLSEGQKYRLILARALLFDRPFLLLDEPFASLDSFSCAAVCTALSMARAAGKGIVVVSHIVPRGFEVDREFDFQTVALDREEASSPWTQAEEGCAMPTALPGQEFFSVPPQ